MTQTQTLLFPKPQKRNILREERSVKGEETWKQLINRLRESKRTQDEDKYLKVIREMRIYKQLHTIEVHGKAKVPSQNQNR